MSDLGRFPRGTELPTQSPLFWVENKDRYLRQLLISDIEVDTGRDLLVYFTDCDQGNAQIDHTDDVYLQELLQQRKSEKLDLLIETNGGLTDAAEKICSILTDPAFDLRVIVPRRAKSNGTVIAFTGSTILMGPGSELGPIDPSIAGIPADFIVNANPPADAISVQYAKMAIAQTTKLGKQLLAAKMMKGRPDADIDVVLGKIANRSTYHSHGSVIDAQEAKSLGLHVTLLEAKDPLWKKIWMLRTMYSFDCRQRGYSKLFESKTISSPVVVVHP